MSLKCVVFILAAAFVILVATSSRKLKQSLNDHSLELQAANDKSQVVRPPTNQGFGYTEDKEKLRREIDAFLKSSKSSRRLLGSPRAIIVPHTTLSLCGDVAAAGFVRLNPETIRRIFLIGPSHNIPFEAFMLSRYGYYGTPFGEVPVDREVNAELSRSQHFGYMQQFDDMMEHSLENVLPFVGRVMEGKNYTLVPILAGDVTPDQTEAAGVLLAAYLQSKENVFVISSDMCHWGETYDFTFTFDNCQNNASETVRLLDRQAMEAIGSLRPEIFENYLNTSGNNICGQVAISLLLHAQRVVADKSFKPTLISLDYKVCRPTEETYLGCSSAIMTL